MAQEPDQAARDATQGQQREWDRQSIYLRLPQERPMAFWVWGDRVDPLSPRPELFDYDGDFGWGQESDGCMALAVAIVAKLVEVGLVAPELATAKSRYLHDEVLVKLPADELRDLHLSYLRLLLG
jgi:hypothetical protein